MHEQNRRRQWNREVAWMVYVGARNLKKYKNIIPGIEWNIDKLICFIAMGLFILTF